MPSRLQEHRTFLTEFRRNFHTTGAILPSGRALASALTSQLDSISGPRRILEAGPGTGPVTDRLLSQLGPDDRLDLVEWNASFVELLNQRFERDPRWQPAAARCRVIQEKIERFSDPDGYDLIISGLPLNNFAVVLVEKILDSLKRLVRPGGIVSFFEYVAIRKVRATVSRGHRQRLRGIDRVLGQFLKEHAIGRDLVWRNFPPAWAHHARIGNQAKTPTDAPSRLPGA